MKKILTCMLLIASIAFSMTSCVVTEMLPEELANVIEDAQLSTEIVPEFDPTSGYVYEWYRDGHLNNLLSGAPNASNIATSTSALIINTEAKNILLSQYNITLADGSSKWSDEYATILLDAVETLYEYPQTPSKWILSKEKIHNDIYTTYGESNTVCISEYAFANSVPVYAEMSSNKGTLSSNRLYYAVVRYTSNNGTDAAYIDRLLKAKYGCSIMVEDYAELTKYTTQESNENFEPFKPEELLAIVKMFTELPNKYDTLANLKYLVRRLDGNNHPKYPQAAAVSWPTIENGYIEFMDDVFMGSQTETTYRLIAHEKAHFIWDTLTEAQRQEWIKLGDWKLTGGEWSTSQEIEFVSAYAHDIGPEEDFAESLAYYMLIPNKLKTVAEAKYEFLRTEVMGQQEYILKIDDNMTFEVYNNYPDYNYPGQIVYLRTEVKGQPTEDKQVTVTIEINTNGDPMYGAEKAFIRITSADGTFYDLWMRATDSTKSVLTGTFTLSKYATNGYWTSDNVRLVDSVGNNRYCEADTYGWHMYVLNALADSQEPEYQNGSAKIVHEYTIQDGHNVTLVHVKFKAQDNIGIRTVYCELVNTTINGYRLAEYGTYDAETGEATVTFVFPEFMQSGMYAVTRLMMVDLAENQKVLNFNASNYPAQFEFYSCMSDTNNPILDLNKTSVSATPTHPENPDGETKVVLEYFANDDISGLDMVSFRLVDPTGKTHFFYHYHDNFYTTFFKGDPTQNKKYVAEVVLPRGSAPGTWGVLEMTLTDKAGNKITYNFTEIVHFNVNN